MQLHEGAELAWVNRHRNLLVPCVVRQIKYTPGGQHIQYVDIVVERLDGHRERILVQPGELVARPTLPQIAPQEEIPATENGERLAPVA